jgi:hypothetical protein
MGWNLIMYILNPVINIKKPFFSRFFGFQYKVYLEFAYEVDRGNTRSSENGTKFARYFKNKEKSNEHVKYIQSKLKGATPRIDNKIGFL